MLLSSRSFLALVAASLFLFGCVTTDPKERVDNFLQEMDRDAEEGDSKAIFTVARYAFEGVVPIKDTNGLEVDVSVGRNYVKAYKNWQKLIKVCEPKVFSDPDCRLRHSMGLFFTGIHKKFGLGTDQDFTKSYNAFRQITDNGKHGAKYYGPGAIEVADTYIYGKGGPRDVDEGLRILKGIFQAKRFQPELPLAYDLLAYVLENGISSLNDYKKDTQEAKLYRNKAAEARANNSEILKRQAGYIADAIKRAGKARAVEQALGRDFDNKVMLVFGAIAAARIAAIASQPTAPLNTTNTTNSWVPGSARVNMGNAFNAGSWANMGTGLNTGGYFNPGWYFN
jgi:hypothetical protein